MTNAQIAKLLGQIATLLEMDGANPFRVRAYRDGSRVIETLPEPAAQLAQTEGRLQQVKGIGKDLEVRIRDLVTTGSTGVYDELTKKFPASLVELTEIPGLGPKRVKLLFDALGIRGRDDLTAAARAGRLREVHGLGETVEAKLLKYLEREVPAGPSRLLLHGAWQVAHDLAAAIGTTPGVERVELAGSFRRRRETIGDLDLVVCGGAAEGVMTAFTTHAYVAEVLARGETRSSVRLGNGLQVDLRHVPAASFGAALLYFTGSKAHNIELRRLAIERGWSLNEYGLTEGERVVAARTEEDIYRALGLAYVPPELREGLDEVARAREGTLPKLVDVADLRADLHMHTDRSDGRDTLADMVRAARDRGYEYCAITEHSGAIGMIRGFDDARVLRSATELDAVRREVPGITVLHGLEVDILADGALDLGDAALDVLDWVVISLHASLAQPREAITARVLRALDHPAVCVMGHPSGRKIGAREGADLDWERVFERAAERGVAMELNAQPDRVDLNDVNARLAKAKGVAFTIDTDAHATDALDYIRYGVFQARRAGLTADDVLNTRPLEAFERWRRAKKRSAVGAAPPAAVATQPDPPTPRGAEPLPSKPPSRTGSKPAAATKPRRATTAKPAAKPARRGAR
jgi:DNA polymerase (family 10)